MNTSEQDKTAPAAFTGQAEPVIVWAGITPPAESSQVILASNRHVGGKTKTVRMKPGKADLYSYLTTPRLLSEVKAWLEGQGRSQRELDRGLRRGELISVPPGSGAAALQAFTNYRLTAVGERPAPVAEGAGDVHFTDSSGRTVHIPWLLAEIIWAPLDIFEDLPQTVARIMADYRLDQSLDEASEVVLRALPAVLAAPRTWLEPVSGRKIGRGGLPGLLSGLFD